jgi:hypothetical protein
MGNPRHPALWLHHPRSISVVISSQNGNARTYSVLPESARATSAVSSNDRVGMTSADGPGRPGDVYWHRWPTVRVGFDWDERTATCIAMLAHQTCFLYLWGIKDIKVRTPGTAEVPQTYGVLTEPVHPSLDGTSFMRTAGVDAVGTSRCTKGRGVISLVSRDLPTRPYRHAPQLQW